nr:hypothetical protein [Lachnospiraceae bacterium]
MNKKKKFSRWGIGYGIVLTLYVVYTLLDAFVIPAQVVKMDSVINASEAKTEVAKDKVFTEEDEDELEKNGDIKIETSEDSDETTGENDGESTNLDSQITDTTYTADGVSITLTEKTVNDTQVYIADVYLDDPSKLLSGLANDSFGRNVSETSSS